MKTAWWVWLIVIAMLEGYFLTAIGRAGSLLNLGVVVVLILSSRMDIKPAILIGLWTGFWLDTIALSNFGVRSLTLAVWGATIFGLGRLGIDWQRRLNIFIAALLGSFLFNVVIWGTSALEVRRWLGVGAFLNYWLIAALTGAVVAGLAYRWPKRLVLYR